jgi:hypothetical protein
VWLALLAYKDNRVTLVLVSKGKRDLGDQPEQKDKLVFRALVLLAYRGILGSRAKLGLMGRPALLAKLV